MKFLWNFSNWKTAVGGFSSPDLEREIRIDGSTLSIQLRKEKLGGLITFKFASFTTKNYYSMSLDQLSELRAALDELDKEARNSSS